MRISDSFVDAWSGRVLSILRIIVAFLFMTHGMGKLFAFPIPAPNRFHLASLIGVAGLLEFFGGVLLLIGLFTRPVAFILSGEMAFAYFLAHAPHGFWPIINHGELAVVYCFVFLYLAVAGGGVYSLDALRHGRAARNDVRTSFGARGI
ncbi:MAG TPA: DoxX family protein [Casimicrobiaceae bacterium]|nr:DoxX family protein [Casimicrobiaceae bacterium]